MQNFSSEPLKTAESRPKRIGVLGGSFNPIHQGHVQLALSLLRQELVEEIWFMLSPQNPHKVQNSLCNEQARWQLLQKALAPYPKFRACDFELSLPRPSYTYHSLRYLRHRFPNALFSLIIGQDNWEKFHLWAETDEILTHHDVIVYPRVQTDSLPTPLQAQTLESAGSFNSPHHINTPSDVQALPHFDAQRIHLLQAQLLPISSTDIRRIISQKGDISQLVPPHIVTDCYTLYAE